MDAPAPTVRHLTRDELDAALDDIRAAPKDRGVLEAIVIRPGSETRESLTSCNISLTGGVDGDRWAHGCWMTTDDGRPHPDVQICIMGARVIRPVAQSQDRWPLAGDNLFIDMDLSADNLPPGTRLAIGSAVIEVTAVPHGGCEKFAARFGRDALRFVNAQENRALKLRGIYARVVTDGTVTVGDAVIKVD